MIRLVLNIHEINKKIDYFGELRDMVEDKLQRDLEVMEARALAFLLERTWRMAPEYPEQFLGEILQIRRSDSTSEASFKIYTAIYKAKILEADERIARAGVVSEEAEEIRSIRRRMEASHSDILSSFLEYGSGDMHLGGIIEHWQPEWVKMITT